MSSLCSFQTVADGSPGFSNQAWLVRMSFLPSPLTSPKPYPCVNLAQPPGLVIGWNVHFLYGSLQSIEVQPSAPWLICCFFVLPVFSSFTSSNRGGTIFGSDVWKTPSGLPSPSKSANCGDSLSTTSNTIVDFHGSSLSRPSLPGLV